MSKAIIFDLDGTLWDSSKEIQRVWKKEAELSNIEINDIKIQDILGLTKNEIVKYLFKSKSEEGENFISNCQKKENLYLLKNGGHIYKNTINTIINLYNNYDLYIISNCQSGYIESFLKHYSLEKYFKDYECSGNTGLSKEKNIEIIIKRNQITKSIYVGDTNKDYKAAKENNIPFIWAEYGFGTCDKYYKKIRDINELRYICF